MDVFNGRLEGVEGSSFRNLNLCKIGEREEKLVFNDGKIKRKDSFINNFSSFCYILIHTLHESDCQVFKNDSI